ncbi:MAG: hypothetical protein Q4G03_04505 [Planctomycetia bacterium]|nr:hypothetical protein [Planctomycetia bacterium]
MSTSLLSTWARFTSLLILIVAFVLPSLNLALAAELERPLDRHAIVERHVIETDALEALLPVANGNISFNVDGAGMQTFRGDVLSHWGWFSEALPEKFVGEKALDTGTFATGRLTGSDPFPKDKGDLYNWIRQSPHQMNLARTRLLRADGQELKPEDIKNLKRTLDPWTGVHVAEFEIDGAPVRVATCISNEKNLDSTVALCIDSKLVRNGALIVVLDLPYPSLDHGAWTGLFGDKAPQTPFVFTRANRVHDESAAILERTLKNDYGRGVIGDFSYDVRVDAQGATTSQRANEPAIVVTPTRQDDRMEISICFDGGSYVGSPCDHSVRDADPLSYDEVEKESRERWEEFWRCGGAVDLSESEDPRWFELERRIVLSQFQMGCNAAGDWPCSESGLIAICPWSGRFHLEMVWWHILHWYVWDRAQYADKSINIYDFVKDGARELARQLDYRGYKWQKEIAPDGRTAPWVGNLALLWKQPHPIFFAEMEYRRNPTRETLERWQDIVEQTAEHIADYPKQDENGVYHLDPVMPPSELGFTVDTVFDLAYWRFALDYANLWRVRLGEEPNANWQKVRDNLAPLPQKDGYYVHSAQWSDTYVKRNWEHPDLVGVYGMLPPLEGVDKQTTERSVERAIQTWQWNRCWGWDFPWTAMAASRVGRPELAVDMLLNDSVCNVYDVSGVNLGGPAVGGGKGPYLPGNGGLLYAIAGMCVGYDEYAPKDANGAPLPEPSSGDQAPGFPAKWKVKWEGLKRPL